MTFSAIVANWPWMAAYVFGASFIFIWLRSFSSTDAEAAELATQSRAFDSPTSLAKIGVEFFRIATPRVLLIVIVLTWTARLIAGQ